MPPRAITFHPPRGPVPDWEAHPGLEPESVFTKASTNHYATRKSWENSRYDSPIAEPIFIALKINELCKILPGVYPEDHPMKGQVYYYKPITEFGWTFIDTRDLAVLSTPPGDRGRILQRHGKVRHYIINEFRGHFGSNCCNACDTSDPYSFAYGTSRYVWMNDVKQQLERMFGTSRGHNRTPYEKANKIYRNIFFITWDPQVEESALDRMGIDWVSSAFQIKKAKLSEVMNVIGLRSIDNRPPDPSNPAGGGRSLIPCAGNNAAFQIQVLLSLRYMELPLVERFCSGRSLVEGEGALKWMPFSWSETQMDNANIPPGETTGRRNKDEKNHNWMPQKITYFEPKDQHTAK
ncbi:hypothetical protein F53441_7025 [Fusarium austroafricanum]|uniref:Gfd2/YDR514C-like C-terminal domain-containing protein n=1 Tax=Fusarium austroafricanum TaxID=2364996 RepID=A0A8H4KEI4_9HYPO|nr:hypothetical protein F53441_7025 [Fusarium austroafricanum]